jgi:hypothetical protein
MPSQYVLYDIKSKRRKQPLRLNRNACKEKPNHIKQVKN